MSSFSPPETVPLTRARADLGPLVRWVASRRVRVVLADRGRPVAVLISAGELADLDRAARRPDGGGADIAVRGEGVRS